jgi:hypothetical protein
MEAQSPEALRKQTDTKTASSPIAQGYLFFCASILAWLGESKETTERIGHLHTALREWIRMVVVDLAADDDPQLIFETLNARGTPLLPADLVKNHLFHMAQKRKLSVEKLFDLHWRHFDDEAGYWRAEVVAGRVKRSRIDLFLQHYLSLRTGEEVQVAHLYAACRSYLARSDEPPEQHLESLSRYSRVFRSLDQFPSGSRLSTFFSRLEELETTTAHPLLLHLFSIGLSPDALERVAADLESFLMRRLVCRLTTKNYNRLFLDILKAARSEPDVASAVQRLLLEGTGDSVRWPGDKEFRDAWLEMPVYRTLARRRVRMILEALEVASRGPKTEALGVPKKLTIEHLLPQSWQDHWPLPATNDVAAARLERERLVHTMGNLTLLTQSLNPATSNAPWKTKKAEIQKHSVLLLNHQITAVESWDETAIRERGAALLDRAYALWPRPATEASQSVPSYATLGRQVMASEVDESAPKEPGGLACPIEGCNYMYGSSLAGWDGHVGSLKRHPQWHPELVEPKARRRAFKAEFAGFLPDDIATEAADSQYWMRRAHAGSMKAFVDCKELIETVCHAPRWSYAKRYIALGGPERNFAWFRPRRDASSCNLHLRVQRIPEDLTRDEVVARLRSAGLDAAASRKRMFRLGLTASDIAGHRQLLAEIFGNAYNVMNSIEVPGKG